MYSSLIENAQKAQRYVQEPYSVKFQQFSATFRGEYNSYKVGYNEGDWWCSCDHFKLD